MSNRPEQLFDTPKPQSKAPIVAAAAMIAVVVLVVAVRMLGGSKPATTPPPAEQPALAAQPEQARPGSTLSANTPAAEPGPEVIRQGGGTLSPTPAATDGTMPAGTPVAAATPAQATAEPATPAASPLAGLPGYVPPTPSTGTPARVLDVGPDSPTLLEVRAVELLKTDAASLRPLTEFLGSERADLLDDDEFAALAELFGHLADRGVVRPILAGGKTLVRGGGTAAIDLSDPAAPSDSSRTLVLRATPVAQAAEGEGGEPTVRIVFALSGADDATGWVVSPDPAVPNIGTRTRAADVAIVPDRSSFYFVRRATSPAASPSTGPAGERAILAAVRAQILPRDATK